MDCACSGTELYIFDFEGCGAGGCAAEEGELEGDWGGGVVVLRWVGVGEVCQGEIVEDCCCVATVGDLGIGKLVVFIHQGIACRRGSGTSSNAPFWTEIGAVLVIALGSDTNGVHEGRVEGRHIEFGVCLGGGGRESGGIMGNSLKLYVNQNYDCKWVAVPMPRSNPACQARRSGEPQRMTATVASSLFKPSHTRLISPTCRSRSNFIASSSYGPGRGQRIGSEATQFMRRMSQSQGPLH